MQFQVLKIDQSIVTEFNNNWLRPGTPKNCSMTKLPVIIETTIGPTTVITGINAFRKAW